MATSVITGGLSAPEGPGSSRSGSRRPCALNFPDSGASSSTSSSKLLDELAEVACSPQSPLMKAVQAVWPDFNLSPLDPKTNKRRNPRSAPATCSSSPLKPSTPVKPSNPVTNKPSNNSKSKAAVRFNRTMSADNRNAKTASNSTPATNGHTTMEDMISRFAKIPSAALRCFESGSTLLTMPQGTEADFWVATETLRQHYPEDEVTSVIAKDLAEMTRLLVVDCHLLGKKKDDQQEKVRLTFRVMPTVYHISAICPTSHPFLVEKKGWTSLDPGTTYQQYGLFCQLLSATDLCVPPVTMEDNGIGREEIMPTSSCSDSSSPDVSEDEDDDSEESRAARLLSQLATGQLLYNHSEVVAAASHPDEQSPNLGKRRAKKRTHDDYYEDDDLAPDMSGDSGSEDYDVKTDAARGKQGSRKKITVKKIKPAKKKIKKPKLQDGEAEVNKKNEPGSKRPMNAFMLFAQKYRQEVTKQHPGKDNRAISTLLGTYWKELDSTERVAYVVEARSLAQQHQKLYPNCWKRKRTNAQAAAAAAAAKN